ncbi:hypothetical protein [Hydromonas duriensis]|uniref:Uncharacterized protein n=1 Tax=Hydromonas duriensis TaxID=1527608 RepID=A0A4R6Y3X1_9BURK|nr:hypothetical protein [Hydromonas duriensis]TDR31081.1 hypothetical protein DFR44_11334 [Hydromonas duriensis]
MGYCVKWLGGLCAILYGVAHVGYAQDMEVQNQALTEQVQLPHDPRVNPKVSFFNKYRSKGPIRIYFSYETEKGKYNSKLNQLTVVTQERLTVVNGLAAFGVAAGAMTGQFSVGNNPYGFQTRDAIVGYKIEDIADRSKLENPALNDIPQRLDQDIIQYVNQNPSIKARQYYESLFVRPWQWSLVFDDVAAGTSKNNYILKFKASLSKTVEGDARGFFHRAQQKDAVCMFESDSKSLEQWRKDDYAEVAALRPKIIDKCISSFNDSFSELLQEDEDLKKTTPEKRIRSATLLCKNMYRQCISIAKDEDDETKLETLLRIGQTHNDTEKMAFAMCKSDYKQCNVDLVKPLIAATPIGQCRIKLDACKIHSKEKIREIGKEAVKAEYKVCVAEYEKCTDSVGKDKNQVNSEDIVDKDLTDGAESDTPK